MYSETTLDYNDIDIVISDYKNRRGKHNYNGLNFAQKFHICNHNKSVLDDKIIITS